MAGVPIKPLTVEVKELTKPPLGAGLDTDPLLVTLLLELAGVFVFNDPYYPSPTNSRGGVE